jgi:hypothetical protein
MGNQTESSNSEITETLLPEQIRLKAETVSGVDDVCRNYCFAGTIFGSAPIDVTGALRRVCRFQRLSDEE